jgi:hypothetical protein
MTITRFLTKQDIGALVNKRGPNLDVTLQRLEADGFPRPDPIIGDWWGPAVKAFFDRRAGLGEPQQPTAVRADGEENWR